MPYMPKITVSNLPVRTLVNATIEVEDGPDHTLHERIAAGVRAGRWKRAEGQHAEEYGDIDLEADTRALDYPQWSFDILARGPTSPARVALTYGRLPTLGQFRKAWEHTVGKANVFSFENDKRAGTCSVTSDELWLYLKSSHAEHEAGDDAAGTWCSDVLGILGIEWV